MTTMRVIAEAPTMNCWHVQRWITPGSSFLPLPRLAATTMGVAGAAGRDDADSPGGRTRSAPVGRSRLVPMEPARTPADRCGSQPASR